MTVCVLVDVANKWTRNELDPLLLQVLHLHKDKPAVLVLNKVSKLALSSAGFVLNKVSKLASSSAK